MSDSKTISRVLIYFQHNSELNSRIQDMAAAAGWKQTGHNNYNILFFGYDPETAISKRILHDSDRDPSGYVSRQYPTSSGWTHINADTEWEKVEALFGPPKPEFDETPLPYDMNPELQAETMAKFNLSKDQWELMPIMVREALAGCEVKAQAKALDYKWHPVSEPELEALTILFTSRPGEGNEAARHNGIGFFTHEGDGSYGIRIRVGPLSPREATHWCYLPGL